MNTEQAPSVSNFLLVLSRSTSPKELSSLPPQTIGLRKVTKLIADFISPTVPLLLKSCQTLCLAETYPGTNKPGRVFPYNTYESLEKSRNKLIVSYALLSGANRRDKRDHNDEDASGHKLLKEVLAFMAYQDLNYNTIFFLDCLAGLALNTREETLWRYCYTSFLLLYSTSWPLDSFLHQYRSHNVQIMLNTIHISSLALESRFASVFSSKSTSLKKNGCKDFVLCSPGPCFSLTHSDLSTERDLSCYSGALECLKSRVCSEDCLEGESENHEQESTTSGSSRASHNINGTQSHSGEPDIHSSDSVALDFLENGKLMSYVPSLEEDNIDLPQEISEYYDGCFFGDLEIEFKASDRLLIEEEDYYRGRFYNYYPYNGYNNYNPSLYRSPVYGGKTSNYPQKTYGGSGPEYNNGYKITYEPKKSPQPASDHKIIPIPLFTVPNNVGDIPFNLNLNNPRASYVQDQFKPETKRKVSYDITPSVLQSAQAKGKDMVYLHKSAKDQVHEPHKNLLDKKEMKGVVSSPPNLQMAKREKLPKKQYAVTEKKNRKHGKNQDKGDIKLWDMINVKGKLADTRGK